jgi:5'-phosphate synthase pdxT subunit
MGRKSVGILALQGDFEAHSVALCHAGARPVEVRAAADLDSLDGLILPGGESTTMLKLLRLENLFDPICRFGEHCPVFGTCAGAILLARHVSNPAQESLGLMDLDIERNAYGRQISSHVVQLEDAGELGPLEAVFIRAPIIRRVGPGVRVLARYRSDPVLVRQGHLLAATFHPELSSGKRIHEFFLRMLEG